MKKLTQEKLAVTTENSIGKYLHQWSCALNIDIF